MNQSRRDFLGKSLILATGAAVAPVATLAAAAPKGKKAAAAAAQPAPSTIPPAPARHRAASFFAAPAADKLAGFIVSDAHFGWLHGEQPAPAEQRRIMDTIMARFPALDVFLDTGDAHHDYALDTARGDWTDVIQGGCDAKPFHYIAGNHDNNNSLTVDDKFYDYDSEFRTNTFSSIECQPYYSFDIKGIHFVSLPEAMDQAYVSDAAIAWLKLDLAVHKTKTTIVLSHNALKGTTTILGDPGYRQVSNSDALLALFKQHPQVAAWMHGHNHNYEIVPLDGALYVSNGRIGGFDPNNKTIFKGNPGAMAGGTLGGIYFEITRDALAVRCFNASQNKFFDELAFPGCEKLTHTLRRATSFDAAEPRAINFGYGGAPHGQRLRAYRHHAGGERTLYITGAPTPAINENPDFLVYAQRDAIDWQTQHLSGYSFEPNEENSVKHDPTWEWRNPGVRIHRRPDAATTKAILAPGATLGQRSYYRCAPGQRYKLALTLDAGPGGQRATPEFRVYDKHFTRVAREQGGATTLPPGRSERAWEFTVPPLENVATLYTDTETDNDLMLTTGMVFGNVAADIDILSFRLTHADATGDANATLNPAITVDGQRIAADANLLEGEIRAFPLPAPATERTTYAIEAQGNCRVTWLEKQRAPRHQIRNATARYENGLLIIGPLRNHFSEQQEVVIAPLTPPPAAAAGAAAGAAPLPYVHRIRHAKQVSIREATPENRAIEINVGGLWIHDQGGVDIVCPAAPKTVAGAGKNDYTYDAANALLTLRVKREKTYKLAW